MLIHDRGYKPYDGPRLSPRHRYKVLFRRFIGAAWQPKSMKVLLILSAGPVFVFAAVMFFQVHAARMMAEAGAVANELPMKVPKAGQTIFYCMYWCQIWFALAVTVRILAPSISNDVRTGALLFYLSRPISRLQYATARVVAAALLIALIVGLPGVLLAIFRMSLSNSWSESATQLGLVLRTLLFTAAYVPALTLPPLALSVLSARGGHAQAVWLATFFLPWALGETIAKVADLPFALAASLPSSLRIIGQTIFDTTYMTAAPVYVALIGLGIYVGLSVLILRKRLLQLEVV